MTKPRKKKATPTVSAQQTGAQSPQDQTGLDGCISGGEIPGFFPAAQGSYNTYRQIMKNSAVALARAVVRGPVESNPWIYKKASEDVPDEWLEAVRSHFDLIRHKLKKEMLFYLDFGNVPFEVMWERKHLYLGKNPSTMGSVSSDGVYLVPKFKRLNWEWSNPIVDKSTGDIVGIENKPKFQGAKKVNLFGPYCLWFINHGLDEYYGDSRNEHVRQDWSEAEQIRQCTAQYAKKISRLILKGFFPLGTTKDQVGADRPNQWVMQRMMDAVSQGKSAAWPNLYIQLKDFTQKGSEQADTLVKLASLSDKSPFNLSAFEPEHADHLSSLIALIQMYDQRFFYGWLRSPRTALEARHGDRGTTQQHSEMGIDDGECVDQDIAVALNEGPVNDMLVANFGKDARDAVSIDCPEMSDNEQQMRLAIAKQLIASTKTIFNIDTDQLFTSIDVPVTAGTEVQNPGPVSQGDPVTKGLPQVEETDGSGDQD